MLGRGLAVAGVVALLDQITKLVILETVMNPPRVIEVTPFFNLVLVWNRGISFGILDSDVTWIPLVLSLLAIVITGILVVWLRRTERSLAAVAIGLVIGGAVGNVIDRVRFGAVVDFLDFHAFGWHWPAFNVADAAITTGVALILLDSLFESRGKHV